MFYHNTISISTRRQAEMVDITHQIQELIPPQACGACVIYSMHTTAGMTINENADPDVATDLLGQLEKLVPWQSPHFRHGEGNSAAHLKASLLGLSVMVPVSRGKLMLGTWQGIYFCEFDGPRQRRIMVQLLPQPEEG